MIAAPIVGQTEPIRRVYSFLWSNPLATFPRFAGVSVVPPDWLYKGLVFYPESATLVYWSEDSHAWVLSPERRPFTIRVGS